MKTIKFLSVLLTFIFMLSSTVHSQTRKKKPTYPQWSINPIGGVSLPIGTFGDEFKTGPSFGLDVSYKVNKEVGFYVEGAYNIFASKLGGAAADGKYLEYTIGPRYYFTAKNLKSAIFLEAGLGGYSFTQDAYAVNDSTTTGELTDSKFGFNAGLGAILNLGRDVDFIVKVKYHTILTPDGSKSYISPMLGIDIRL
ncbi:MAG: porin family protein [Bacteroidota bacterium]|nr:porin family protein [Bacteroidota bacterium]